MTEGSPSSFFLIWSGIPGQSGWQPAVQWWSPKVVWLVSLGERERSLLNPHLPNSALARTQRGDKSHRHSRVPPKWGGFALCCPIPGAKPWGPWQHSSLAVLWAVSVSQGGPPHTYGEDSDFLEPAQTRSDGRGTSELWPEMGQGGLAGVGVRGD